jgi:hypothetical protein
LAGGFYVVTIVAGSLAAFGGGGMVANLVAGLSYVVVTILFYFIFRPASPGLSLLAMLLSLAGCAWGVFTAMRPAPIPLNALVFFGFYCLLIGWLIFRSTFLPKFLGVLMILGGFGWLTYALPALAKSLAPWNMLPGIIGETTLTLWLLVKGVNVPKWKEQSPSTRS